VQREDQFLEDVLKIFHNSKVSVQNTITKWHHDEQSDSVDEHEHLHAEWKPYPETPFKHASGQFEPLSRKLSNFKHSNSKVKSPSNIEHVSQFPESSPLTKKQSDS